MMASMAVITLRPPIRSASIPAGRRHIAPLSTASALTQESWVSVSPNSSWMGLPRMPNISHTANISVNATVDVHMTRVAPEGEADTGPVAGAGVLMSLLIKRNGLI
ncbi:hypothetical protein BJF86_04875 [Serinicoccus sp. CNJ-927]|nr:hypothetical protein BJF86_04875 [Serinicoccus sp. CNJ-927]